MERDFSGFLIAAAQSGSGKTTISLGLLRALKRRGISVQPFKCGPDFIDPAFHEVACGENSLNLDTWMMGEEAVKQSWSRAVQDCSVALIEGVMGLFDGRKVGALEGSSADISRTLSVPVLLVVNAKGMSGSIAPLVKGYATYHPQVKIVGVIANCVGSKSHANLLKEHLEVAGVPPLLGYLLRDERLELDERHLGLIPAVESEELDKKIDLIAAIVEETFEIDTILALTKIQHPVSQNQHKVATINKRVAIAYDKAFHFYYQENINALEALGYTISYFSPLCDEAIPPADLLYIGGGFPEIFAAQLEANNRMQESIRAYAEGGGAIFAECGGYVYLGKSVTVEGTRYSMCGVIDGDATLHNKRQALGYRTIETLTPLPFSVQKELFRGHEFHYTSMVLNRDYVPLYKTTDSRGMQTKSGVQFKGIYAGYPHIYFDFENRITN